MAEFNVEVLIRKGLGPDWIRKNFPVGFDDVPEDLTESDLRQMAIRDVESKLYNSEDYKDYGKNWKIIEVYNS